MTVHSGGCELAIAVEAGGAVGPRVGGKRSDPASAQDARERRPKGGESDSWDVYIMVNYPDLI